MPQPLDALRAETEAAAAPFLRGAAGPATGRDSTGRVEATLSRDGRVQAVRIHVAWADDLEPVALGAAVMEALQGAANERARAWGDAAVGQEPAVDALGVQAVSSPAAPVPADEPAGVPRPPDAATFDRIRQALLAGRDSVPPEMLQAMVQQLRELNDSIDGVRQQVTASVTAGFVGHSPDRHVEATVNGAGDPTSIRYDERWLVGAHASNIAHQTLEALRAAGRAAAGHDPTSIIASSAIGRVSALLEDPERFVANLDLPSARTPDVR